MIGNPVEVLVILLFCAVGALVVGDIVGSFRFLILLLMGRPVLPVEGPQPVEEVGPIVWRGLCNDRRTGGTRP